MPRYAAALLCVLPAAAALQLTEEYARANAAPLWAAFKRTYRREYAAEEEGARYRVFHDNLLAAAAEQRRNPLATFGVTRFSDYTDEEFERRTMGFRVDNTTAGRRALPAAAGKKCERALVQYCGSCPPCVLPPCIPCQTQCLQCATDTHKEEITAAGCASGDETSFCAGCTASGCTPAPGPAPPAPTPPAPPPPSPPPPTPPAPSGDGVDWRAQGAVTAVKDQGDCGGCWAFSTTGNVEGQYFLAGNKLTELSEQQLLSCCNYFPCMGCGSGMFSCAFEYLKSTAAVTEQSYPYASGKDGNVPSCKRGGASAAKVKRYASVASSESAMASYVKKSGPLSIGAYATQWKQYTGGIMTSCQNQQANHAILIVGYGSEKGQDYWIIKNSWGASWGESGYIRLGKGKDLCQVTSQPTSCSV